HISYRLGVRRVEVEHETTAFARGEFGRLLHANELVHLADGGEVLCNGRRHEERGDEQARKGQRRGPHVTRRGWSPLIYIARSISSKRVKPASPFARRRPVLSVAEAQAHGRPLAEIYGSVLGARTVVQDVSGIHGPLRLPDFEVLWGDGTETVYLEGGVRYAFDVARVMLSPGNIEERLGITNRVRPGAVVADLFAGIGYFTLPLAMRAHPAIVYACELNPISFQYLVRNIRLNRATNVVPLLGDCRDVMPRGVADWVIMGHFDAREYLDVAFAALRTKGTIVYHELCPKEQFPDALTRRLAAATRANWRNVTQMHTRIVKSYAPGIVHAVAEFEVSPRHRM